MHIIKDAWNLTEEKNGYKNNYQITIVVSAMIKIMLHMRRPFPDGMLKRSLSEKGQYIYFLNCDFHRKHISNEGIKTPLIS